MNKTTLIMSLKIGSLVSFLTKLYAQDLVAVFTRAQLPVGHPKQYRSLKKVHNDETNRVLYKFQNQDITASLGQC